MSSVRVMVVEDSAVQRELLVKIIDLDPRLHVVAAVETGEEALRLINDVKPDLITMDIELPGIDGLEAIRRIMHERPTPVVVISNTTQSRELNGSMNALRAGALHVLEKPKGTTSEDYQRVGAKICRQLAAMAQVKVVRQRGRSSVQTARDLAPPFLKDMRIPDPGSIRLIGIAASTGGPAALVGLFNGLGGEFPFPVALVQHISESFLEGFAAWLGTTTPFRTVIVEQRVRPAPATIYLAPRGHHLLCEQACLTSVRGMSDREYVPSANVLFCSMARSVGAQGIGVVLTGMGDDGAEGCLELRNAGAYTFAEDQSSAVVNGMPAAAYQRGAISERLPITEITNRLRDIGNARLRSEHVEVINS